MSTENTLADLGEPALIEQIRRRLPERGDVVVGAGDDCAVVRSPTDPDRDLLLTSDAVIEGIHFDAGTPFSSIGHRAVGRVLSDIAAMGGDPGWALVNIAAPSATPASSVDEFYSGAVALSDGHGLAIIGGDVTGGPAFSANVFAVGSSPRDGAILRSGAENGDLIYVTGSLGGSRSGKHLSFNPRIEAGLLLRDFAKAMIDISDGLATDLLHILRASGVGAVLRAGDIPISEDAMAPNDDCSALDHAMTDGEDHELLFMISPDSMDAFIAAWSEKTDLACTCIGAVNDKEGVAECIADDGSATPISDHGFSHFRS